MEEQCAMQKLKTLLVDEWLNLPPDVERTAGAELSGIITAMARKHQGDEVLLSSRRLPVFRRIQKLWNHTPWRSAGELASFLKIPPQLKGQVHFLLPSKLLATIEQEVKDPLSSSRNWAWLRGCWGTCGSLYLPKTGYYLVFRQNPSASSITPRIRGSLQVLNIRAGERDRLGGREILIREQDSIVTLLSAIGLVKSSLSLEQKAVFRAMRNRANKLVNCDSANIRKSLEAAQKQVRLAKEIERLELLEQLPQQLREVVQTRLQNPSVTLRELGQLLSKPVSKSTVEYRWSKLQKILETWQNGENPFLSW